MIIATTRCTIKDLIKDPQSGQKVANYDDDDNTYMIMLYDICYDQKHNEGNHDAVVNWFVAG